MFQSPIPMRMIVGVIGMILIIALVSFGVRSCDKRRSAAAQAKIERAQTGATIESAKDAINTAGNVSDRQVGGEALGRDNERTIRNAQGSSDPVNPAVRDAGLDGLCKRAAYRDTERCRLRGAPAR